MITLKIDGNTLRVDNFVSLEEGKPVLVVTLYKFEEGKYREVGDTRIELEGISVLNANNLLTEWAEGKVEEEID